jgi:hypothetical protein
MMGSTITLVFQKKKIKRGKSRRKGISQKPRKSKENEKKGVNFSDTIRVEALTDIINFISTSETTTTEASKNSVKSKESWNSDKGVLKVQKSIVLHNFSASVFKLPWLCLM